MHYPITHYFNEKSPAESYAEQYRRQFPSSYAPTVTHHQYNTRYSAAYKKPVPSELGKLMMCIADELSSNIAANQFTLRTNVNMLLSQLYNRIKTSDKFDYRIEYSNIDSRFNVFMYDEDWKRYPLTIYDFPELVQQSGPQEEDSEGEYDIMFPNTDDTPDDYGDDYISWPRSYPHHGIA